jgi:tetratricopeptide (TPR) repeat protein
MFVAPELYSQMLRASILSALTLVTFIMPAIAGPELANDMDACRDRQTEAKARLDACEKAIAAGQVSGKDLAVAYAVRGQAFILKRAYDKAIAAFDAAHTADPDATPYINSRGFAYEGKGDDEHALADYNLVLKMRPNAALALNNRGTLYLRQGAVQSALDDFSAAINANPNLYLARINRGHVLTINKDYDGALKDFAEAERIDPASAGYHSLRCLTYTAMGQFDKALVDCNSVIEKLPKNQYALTSRGDVYLAKGRSGRSAEGLQFRAGHEPQSCACPC